ncbi:MAG TPA: biotin-dependent carboxyltransferase family protein [Nitrospiraceae bacterium]|nr:biotin-dependent carboxyltransferase family protein [Nitrospiraceae bacterium]
MLVCEPTRFRVVRPGLLTTVQDLGRFGFQRFGMPVSGAMDTVALRLANRLVGNLDHAAGLEMTLTGPELFFEVDGVVALTGADLSPQINRIPVPLWTSLDIRQGSNLSFGARRSGARGYLAVAGGLDVPAVMGSRATHLASRTGGFSGRAIAKGDRIACGPRPTHDPRHIGRQIPASARPPYVAAPTLRAVLGPQAELFSSHAVETLITQRYIVSPQANRMGYRLQGPPIFLSRDLPAIEMISDATPHGSLQVPADHQPILLMVDRPTTGGYPKIAVVITADLPLAAQLMPGDTVSFTLIDVHQAQCLAREQRAALDAAVPPW